MSRRANGTRPSPEVPIEPKESARAAGLRYITDASPGIRRKRAGEDFVYLDADGKRIRDRETLARIKSLAIPPAWEDVWICPVPNGYLQATGRDAKGRKQYRYHPRWREIRDETKYARMMAFARALPRIRERTERDMQLPGLPREKVLATVVRLLETTLIRVGNEEYARNNKSYGLSTMRDKHADIHGSTVHFEFRGKSGKLHQVDVHDKRLARIVKRCQDIPGQELFQYLDEEGNRHSIGSADVNEYIHRVAGEEFTAKDFRTWAGTVLAALALNEYEKAASKRQAKKNVVQAIESVAKRLGNTPAICRKCYVHPAVFDGYLDGIMLDTIRQRTRRELKLHRGLRPEERRVLHLLEDLLEHDRRPKRKAG